MKKWPKSVATAGIALAAALALASCSSSTKKSASSDTASAGASSAQSSGQSASGAPITVGLMGDNSGTGAAPDMISAAKAAADYINAKLGGVNGHPLKLVTCDSQGSPESTSECASQLVSDHPVIVVSEQLLSSDAASPIIEKSGIPFVTTLALTSSQLQTKNVFAFVGGGTSGLLAADDYVKSTLHVSNVSVIYVNVAAGVADAQDFVQKPLEAAGVKVQLVPQSIDSPDATTVLSTAASSHPGAVLAVTLPSVYPSLMQLHAQQGVNVPIVYQSNGLDPKLVAAGGSGANGSLFTYDFTPFTDTTDTQVATYLQALKSYGGGTVADGESQAGFASVMDTYTMLKKASSGIPTAAQALTAFQNSVNVPGFMSHSFGCKTPAIASLPGLCNTYQYLVQYKGGTFSVLGGSNSWRSGASLLK